LKIDFVCHRQHPTDLYYSATIPNPFKQCPVFADDHPLRYFKDLELKTPHPSIWHRLLCHLNEYLVRL
ncbi:MAG: hypothetical protein PVI62_03795, partial [Desulfobacterales bacterium]